MTPFSYTLRPYQQQAHEWLEAHPKSILADDVGLGKSPTAISVLANHLPALVIAPGYLTQQWYDLLCDSLPTASISLPEGSHGRRKHELQQYADVRVASLEMLRSYDMPTDIQTVVIDEAHRIRNDRAVQSMRARELIQSVQRAHLLTATPYYKSDEDIWHLLHCIDSHTFTSYWDFLRKWYSVNWYAPYTPKIYGISRKKRVEFNQLVSEYMLMRSYHDVGRQLPPLVEKVITFNLPDVLRKEYTKLKRDWQLLGEPIESVGSVYYILRQLTMCADKVNNILNIVDSIPREPILIYTWYKESAYTLAGKIAAIEPCMRITGDTPPNERAQMLATQKRTGQPRIIVATIESLQEGVNMEHIRHVIYAEETYVKGQHHQTISRARRDRGDDAQHAQTQPPVIAYYVRARKTIDEAIPVIRNARGNAGNRELAAAL